MHPFTINNEFVLEPSEGHITACAEEDLAVLVDIHVHGLMVLPAVPLTYQKHLLRGRALLVRIEVEVQNLV